MKLFDIEEELNKLPKRPGVYIMHDKNYAILYVGKAKNLHNRVRQYFRSGHGHNNSPKIMKMVEKIDSFEYIVCESEIEALVLECNLIKEHRPPYNNLMTDDKGYPYIRITVNETFPRIEMCHRMVRDKNLYFGPFPDRKAVKDIILLLRKLYHIRSCSLAIDEGSNERPCLYYQIGQCSAPCAGLITPEEYRKGIDGAIRFLGGDVKDLVQSLKAEMKEASLNLDFETAAAKRDLLADIDHIVNRQRAGSTGNDDRDIIALARNDSDSVVSIFFVRDGKLIDRDNYHMQSDISDTDGQILNEFIKQYYTGTPYVPGEILCETEISESDLLSEYFRDKYDKKITFTIPKKGDKAHLMRLAEENAKLILEQDLERIRRHEMRTEGACREIASLLGIPSASRMEAFDISHISGYHSVASMVVFENGKPKKNAYRKFRLTASGGNDDYASMKEVLSRRFTDEKMDILPDVLMMDGGKGQVNIAEMVLNSLGIDIPVCGMVKDDNHRTRGLYYQNELLSFGPGSQAMHMITALQDETHRFAITYHRELRSKGQIHSVLDDIPGIGPKRRKALLLYFEDIEKIKQADISTLSEVDGMNKASAEAVYEFFHE